MTKQEIDEMLHELSLVLQYRREKQLTFTVGECICINQQRAKLWRLIAYLDGEITIHEVPGYELPQHLKKKITATLNLIERSGWQPIGV